MSVVNALSATTHSTLSSAAATTSAALAPRLTPISPIDSSFKAEWDRTNCTTDCTSRTSNSVHQCRGA